MKINGAAPKERRILAAAEKIFSMHGYEKATLDAIIALADVGKGTVYKYFGSKELLFYKLAEEKNKPFVERLQAAVAGQQGLKQKLLAYMQVMVDFYYDNNELWQIIYFEMLDGRNNCRLQKDNGTYQLVPRYSQVKLADETRERIWRYFSLIHNEYIILEKIVVEAIEAGLLKPGCEGKISSEFLFYGVAMSIFNLTQPLKKMSAAEAAEIIVDRYLYGEAVGGF